MPDNRITGVDATIQSQPLSTKRKMQRQACRLLGMKRDFHMKFYATILVIWVVVTCSMRAVSSRRSITFP